MTVQDSDWRERTLSARREVLRERGVPEPFIEPIATRDENAGTYGGGLWILVPLLGSLGLYWVGFQAYTRWRIESLAAQARAHGAWLYATEGVVGWVGLIALLFALIGASGWIYALVTQRVRPHPAPSLAASMLREGGGGGHGRELSGWLLTRAVRAAAAKAQSADELLAEVGRSQRRMWTAFTLGVGLPAIAAMAVGSSGYWLAGPQGAVRREITATHSYAWSQAKSVEVGCNETKETHDLEYKVAFPDWTLDLGNDGDGQGGRTIPEAQRADALAKVDAILRGQKTPRKRWVWLDRDPMHPACVYYWTAVADQAEPGRLKRLLSLGPQAGP